MDNVKSFVAKVLTTWVAIGAALLTLSTTGFITVPDVFLGLFSQDIADVISAAFTAIFNAVNAVIIAYQAIRGVFVAKEIETQEAAIVKALSTGVNKKFAINPFKLSIAA